MGDYDFIQVGISYDTVTFTVMEIGSEEDPPRVTIAREWYTFPDFELEFVSGPDEWRDSVALYVAARIAFERYDEENRWTPR